MVGCFGEPAGRIVAVERRRDLRNADDNGTSTFTVSVADSESPAETASQQESITVNAYSIPAREARRFTCIPQTPVAPRGSYQTVTAVVTGVNDKTVTWSSDGGTIVGTNPCVVNEPCTVALYTTSPGTYHLTAKSNANNSVTAMSTITITASPTPADLASAPGRNYSFDASGAASESGIEQSAVHGALQQCRHRLQHTINAIWSWSCNGGSGQPNSDQS